MRTIRDAQALNDTASAPLPLALPTPRSSTRCPPPNRSASVLRLIVGTMMVALGLAAVIDGLGPSAIGMRTATLARPRLSASVAASPGWSPFADHAQAPPLALSRDRGSADQPGAAARRPVGVTSPWRSPLAPQNGVTLWERIQVSSSTDPQVFLVGVAIQLYAPQTAATPGPHYNRFP
jgi:hypothetical protein